MLGPISFYAIIDREKNYKSSEKTHNRLLMSNVMRIGTSKAQGAPKVSIQLRNKNLDKIVPWVHSGLSRNWLVR